METPGKYLLTKQQQINIYYLIRETTKEFEIAEGQWEIIGKYHERLWFQEAWQMTQIELQNEYQRLAHLLYRLESYIDNYKNQIHMHNCAREFLHNSRKPFENIDLLKHDLVQTTLL